MNIVFYGPPGVGKGTQSAKLCEYLGLQHLSTGDLIRSEVQVNADFANQCKSVLSSGGLIDDQIIAGLVKKFIQQNIHTTGIIFDGYPRTLDQAVLLDKMLLDFNIQIDGVFCFDSSQEVLIDRITGRYVCGKCNKSYHVNQGFSKDSLCNTCGIGLEKREDDTEDVLRRRLERYYTETEAVMDYYRPQSKVYAIEADRDAQSIFEEVCDVISKKISPC